MTTHKEALTLALELLAVGTFHSPELQAKRTEVIEQGLNALAQPEQEPVAWELGAEVYWGDSPELSDYVRKEGTPLYTTPPQRKPLTDEQIAEFAERMEASDPTDSFWREFARAIEAAHGIKGDA